MSHHGPRRLSLCAILVLCSAGLRADDAEPPAPDERDFDRLFAAIKPQPGESPWREIEWLTDVHDARVKAAAEGKPLLIFTAADGSSLART